MHTASYFAGVGTVVVTMAIGFGGGVFLTDAFVGKSERTSTLMERRAAPLSESTAPVVAAAPAPPAEQQTVAASPQPQAAEQPAVVPQQAVATPVAAPPAAAAQTGPQPATAPVRPNPSAPAAQERAQFEQSMGRMRDADLRDQDAEARKATAAERRKQERRKWAERRKREMQKIDELTAMSEKVKQREREAEPMFRSFADERGAPRPPSINLFDGDDD